MQKILGIFGALILAAAVPSGGWAEEGIVESNNEAERLVETGHPDQAVPLFIRSLDAAKKAYGKDERTDLIAYNLAKAFMAMGNDKPASQILEELKNNYVERYGPKDARLAPVYMNLARSLVHTKPELAEKDIRKSIEIYEAISSMPTPDYVRALYYLGYVQFWAGKSDRSYATYRNALDMSEASFGPDAPITGEVHSMLGLYFTGVKRLKNAEQEYARAVEIFDGNFGQSNSHSLGARAALVGVYEELHQPDKASAQAILLGELAPAAEGQAQPLYRVAPNYPQLAMETGRQGYVDFTFTITTEGRVRDIEVVGGQDSLFERAVREAVSHWIYKPRIVDGKPVDSIQKMRFRFGAD